MNIYTLDGLKELARNKKKAVCAWTPRNPPLKPPEDNPDRIWIHDPTGKPNTYDKEVAKYAVKIVIYPSPIINERKEDKMETFELVYKSDRKKNPEKKLFRSLTFEEAKALKAGDHVKVIDHGGEAYGNVKINGAVQTWKRDPNRISIPCKYGMYEYYTFTRRDIDRLLIRIR